MKNLVEPLYVGKMKNFMGTATAVGKAIGCSGSTISTGLKKNKIAKQYELAAELLYNRVHPAAKPPAVITNPSSNPKPQKELNAENLKGELWSTLQKINNGEIDPKTANAIAAQARTIVSTVAVEITIQNCAEKLSEGVRGFTDVKKIESRANS